MKIFNISLILYLNIFFNLFCQEQHYAGIFTLPKNFPTKLTNSNFAEFKFVELSITDTNNIFNNTLVFQAKKSEEILVIENKDIFKLLKNNFFIIININFNNKKYKIKYNINFCKNDTINDYHGKFYLREIYAKSFNIKLMHNSAVSSLKDMKINNIKISDKTETEDVLDSLVLYSDFELKIKSIPEDTDIQVEKNGKTYSGKTPYRIEKICSDTINLHLTHPDYFNLDTIIVAPKTSEVNFYLKPLCPRIAIRVRNTTNMKEKCTDSIFKQIEQHIFDHFHRIPQKNLFINQAVESFIQKVGNGKSQFVDDTFDYFLDYEVCKGVAQKDYIMTEQKIAFLKTDEMDKTSSAHGFFDNYFPQLDSILSIVDKEIQLDQINCDAKDCILKRICKSIVAFCWQHKLLVISTVPFVYFTTKRIIEATEKTDNKLPDAPALPYEIKK